MRLALEAEQVARQRAERALAELQAAEAPPPTFGGFTPPRPGAVEAALYDLFPSTKKEGSLIKWYTQWPELKTEMCAL